MIAVQQGWELAEVATEAKAQIVSGSSLKAALDRNWDEPQERQEALSVVLAALRAVEGWLETQPQSKADPAVQAHLKTAHQIKAQDVEVTKTGTATLRKGVAKERRISIEDAQMRHGRKSRSCGSMATNATSCTTWIPDWCGRWASRQPMSQKPV